MTYSAGTVFLQVVPSYRGFQESIRRQAKEAAKAFKGEFETETGHSIADAIDKSRPDTRKAAERLGTDAGRAAGGKLHTEVQKAIKNAARSLPKIEVDADTSPAEREIERIRARLAEIGDAHADFKLDSRAAQAQLGALAASLHEVRALAQAGTDMDVDTGAALASLGKLEALKAEVGRDVTINVDVDSGAANAKMAATSAEAHHMAASGDDAANTFRAFNGIILAAVALGPMLIPVLAALAGGLAAIGPAAIAGASGIGVMVLALSGIPAAVSAMNDVRKNSGKDALAAEKTMRTAANGIRDAEESLSRARQQAARTQADSARRIADARRSLADAERQASDDIASAQRREADARRNLADVTEQANRRIAAAHRQVTNARRDLVRAQEDAATRNAAAAEQVVRAEHRVTEAQQESLKAQQDLADARAQAAQDIVDANYEARGAALAQQEAALRLADAQKEYNRVMGREYKSPRAVQEVTLALQEAQLAYEESQTNAQRAAAAADDANKKGVDGADNVVEAQQRIVDAQQAQLDAVHELQLAQADAARTQQEGLQAVADAQQKVTDEVADYRLAQKDAARDIADAQRSVADAARATRDARVQAAQDIANAERGVTDAQREASQAAADSAYAIAQAQQGLADAQANYQDAVSKTGDLGSASMQKLHDAMSQLSPAGQAFATFIYGLRGAFLALRGAAEAGFLPGFQDFISSIVDTYGPSFTKWVGTMAKVMGDLFRWFGRVLTTSPVWREFFATMNQVSPKLMREWGKISINWLTVFVGLMEAFTPLALKLSDWMLKMSDKAVKWVSTLEDTKGFQDFLAYVEKVGPEVAAFFEAFIGAVLNIGRALAPVGEVLLGLATTFLNWIAGMDPKTLQAIIVAIIAFTVAIQAAYGVMSLMLVGFTAFQFGIGLIVAGAVLLVAAIVIMYIKFEWFRNLVDTVAHGIVVAWKALVDYWQWAWDHVLEPVLSLYADRAQWLWKHILEPVFGYIGDAWGALLKGMKWAWDNVLSPAWSALSTAASWLWTHVLSPIFTVIATTWSALATGIAWAWNNIWYPIIQLVGTVIGALWTLQLKIIFAAISYAWGQLADGFSNAWTYIISPALSGMSKGFQWVWDNVLNPIFSGFISLMGGKEGIARAFEHAVTDIQHAWDDLKDIAKAPIRFIIETVLNNGLIAGFNKLADFFGTKKMGEIPLPKGFADGGYTGPGGRFDPAGIVHADEYVINSPARRRFEKKHPGLLDYINQTGRMPGYSSGGWVKPIHAPYGLGYGNTYTGGGYHSGQDFPAPVGTPVFAALPGVIAQVLRLFTSYGHHIVMESAGGIETLYAHLSAIGVNVGQAVGAGQQIGLSGATGHVTGPHLHFEVRPGGGYSHAVNPVPFLSGAANAPEGDGGMFDWVKNPFSWLKDKVTGAFDKMDDNPYTRLLKEVPLSILGSIKDLVGGGVKGVWNFATDTAGKAGDLLHHLNPFGGGGDNPPDGPTLYDNGGWLQPGYTKVLNATGKPEPVFTSDQWALLKQNGAGQSAPGLSIGQLVAADPDDAVRKIRTSQADAAAMANLRDIANGVG